MSKLISEKMALIAEEMGIKFTYKNAPIAHKDVFSDAGLLPAIARRADQLCQLCFGYGIGMRTEKNETALLKKRVIFDDVTPETLRYLCLVDVILELQKMSTVGDAIVLDELQYE